MTMWGQEHKLKTTCCEFHLGLNGHLPPGLAQRFVTVQIMSCERALISADGINWMKPLPLCLHCRRLRATAVFVLFYTRSWHSLCLHVSQAECQHLNVRRLVVIDSGILSTPERNLRLRYLLPVSQRLLSFSMLDLCLIGPLRSATRFLSPFVFVFFCHWTLCRVTELVSYLKAESLTLLPNTERFGDKIQQ